MAKLKKAKSVQCRLPMLKGNLNTEALLGNARSLAPRVSAAKCLDPPAINFASLRFASLPA